MEKKVYVRPLMSEVKININQILTVSEVVGLHNEVSSKVSYSRGYSGSIDDEDDE